MPLKLKTIEVEGKTYAEIVDGHPAYESDDGKTIGFDAQHSIDKITSLNGEAQSHREKAEDATKALKAFEGIEDPAAALKAIETVKGLKDSELIEAGKVEEIKAAAIKAAEEQTAAAIAAKDEEISSITSDRDGLSTALNNELIGGGFGRSTFIKEKLTLTPSIAQATFANNFQVEEGKVVGVNPKDGAKIYSPSKPGELASFDEALEIMVGAHPDRDSIMRGRGNRGGGSDGEGGGGGGGSDKMPRAEFDALPSQQKRKAISDGVTVVDG